MKKIIVVAAFTLLTGIAFGQKYKTSTGAISFNSHATMEDISAKNNQVTGLLESSTGELAYIVLIKSFEFSNALMQGHFNDNYMQSDTYPKSTFSGKITNNSDIDYGKNGETNITVSGKLTIHGVAKDVTATGTISVSGTNVTLKSSFKVKLEDYGIKNDRIKNIANEIEVNVNTTLAKQ
jgi:hypothetical protein